MKSTCGSGAGLRGSSSKTVGSALAEVRPCRPRSVQQLRPELLADAWCQRQSLGRSGAGPR